MEYALFAMFCFDLFPEEHLTVHGMYADRWSLVPFRFQFYIVFVYFLFTQIPS